MKLGGLWPPAWGGFPSCWWYPAQTSPPQAAGDSLSSHFGTRALTEGCSSFNKSLCMPHLMPRPGAPVVFFRGLVPPWKALGLAPLPSVEPPKKERPDPWQKHRAPSRQSSLAGMNALTGIYIYIFFFLIQRYQSVFMDEKTSYLNFKGHTVRWARSQIKVHS